MVKKKFLIIESVKTPSSGAKIRSRNIAKYLAKSSQDVTLIELVPKDYHETIYLKGVNIVTIPCGDSFLDTLKVTNKIKTIINKIKADYIISRKPLPTSCKPAWEYKSLHPKTKIILDIDDIEWLLWENKTMISNYLRRFEEKATKFFDYVTVTCERVKNYVIRQLNYPENKIIMLPNILDKEPINKIKQIKSKIPFKTFIYVASLGISSDLKPILKAYYNLHDETNELEIIGDGDRREEYEKYCEINGIIGVTFLGYLPYSETLQKIANADVALNYARPNFANLYRSPIKLREYLALGKKVVSNEIGDTENLKDYIFLSSDELEDFKEKMKLALKSRLPKGGKEYVLKNYDGGKIIKSLLKSIK